jgi:nuclear-control-of-ATPase protein 2
MLELNQILRANEINFAILAALPAFFLSLFLIMLVRAWFKQVMFNFSFDFNEMTNL